MSTAKKVEDAEKFSGKNDGITFEKLDEKVLSWGRRKFGDKYATLLWKDELYDLNKLDLTDELDLFDFEMHCTLVYDVMCYDSAKYADGLFETQRFWTIQFQMQARQRFRERMYCHLESIVKGEAARQIKKQGVKRMAGMREFLFKRFGAGQPEVLEERVRQYHLGMPDPKTGEAFPPRCDMEAKLDQLEAEREFLVEMCPKEQRDSYEDGKESTLVRIILRHRPKEYDSAVKTVMDLHRFRLYGKDWDVSKITNLEDNSRVNYNTDWLPNYDELRAELISSYQLQKRRREEEGRSTKKSPGHPTLPVLRGFEQPGPHQKTCYGCGEKGHFKGDPACKAGPNEVWSGAPEGFKSKVKNGGKGKGNKGQAKGRGGDRQRNKKDTSGEKKIPCKFFNSGNGYCKWGDNCRHSHEGKKGGKRKPALLLSKKDKKAKKEIAAMVINELKTKVNKEKIAKFEKEKDDDDLYDLVRGKKTTMMVQRRDEGEEYIPRRKVIMMISSESDEDFVPKKPAENEDKKKRDTKKSDVPIKTGETEINCVSGSGSSSDPFPKTTEQEKESINEGTSLFKTPSSDSVPSSDSSSDSSSSEEALVASPESKRIKLSRKKAQKKANKRARRDEQTALYEHEREQVGLALQQQHHLLNNVAERLGSHKDSLEQLTERLDSQKGTLEQLTQELVAVRARAEASRKKREEEFRLREIYRQKMMEDSRRREEGYKIMLNESELRARARANEKREMLAGLDNYAAIQRARLDVLRKDKREDQCARVMRKRAERKRDARKARKAKPAENFPSSLRVNRGATSLRGEKVDACKPAMESAQDRSTRLALEDEHFHLSAEIRRLEAIKVSRWKELVRTNQWDKHEEDEIVIALDEEIEKNRLKQLKVYTLLNENKKKVEERDKGMKDLIAMATGKEAVENLREGKGRSERVSPNTLNLQSSSVDWEEPEDDEKLDYLFLVKVKKGEKRVYTQFLLNNDKKVWEGPFALETDLNQLLRHNNTVHPNEDSWKLTRDKEVVNSDDGAKTMGQFYQGFSKAVRGQEIPGVGLKELLESERRKKEREELNKNIRKKDKEVRESRKDVPGGFFEPMKPRFNLGQQVYYFVEELGNEKWHSARVIAIAYPGEEGHPFESEQIRYTLQPNKEEGQDYDNVKRKENQLRDWSWARPSLVIKEKNVRKPLVPLDLVGIDTCSALSVSSRKEDFLWVDNSLEAKRSIILRGVGGDSTRIGGRGPMVVAGKDMEGKEVLIFDPSAVYLDEKYVEADFRIFGQQRLKAFGFNLLQQDESRGGDVLSYNNGNIIIPLLTNDGILALQTHQRKLSEDQMKLVDETIEGALRRQDGLDYCIPVSTTMIMNEAYLSDIEAARLKHWRLAHRVEKNDHLNENCPVCAEGKKKTGTFKRNYEFMGSTRGEAEPYFRLYCDGYGGQNSMGDLSYQGGIGGFVFACPRGSVKIKLYGSTEQFPSILFQVLQEIESEGYVTREVYVDTHSVNLSKAAEEVAAMYRVRIIPVSAGTPQEMAYAESAVRVIGQMGRTLMCGAPHLPAFCWGLADLQAGYIHNLTPQAKLKKSPFEDRTGRVPDLDTFFVRVFGAPCQYAPIEGAEHKRARKTEWGWFVGMQMPMCLVLRPEDDKIISVSRKKIIVHEEFYAKFDPAKGGLPLDNFTVPVINLEDIKTETENLETIKEYKERMKIPDHVLSIRSLSDYKKHPELNEPTPTTRPSPAMMKQLDNLTPDPGEKTTIHVPEHEMWNKDLLQDKIKQLRESINKHYDKGGKVEAIVKALRKAEEEASNDAERRHILKKRSKLKDGQEVLKSNILPGRRRKVDASEPRGFRGPGKEEATQPFSTKRQKTMIGIGDRVKIKTKAFGKGYAAGKPTFTYGYVRAKKGDLFDVEWDAGDSMMTHKRHLSTHDSESEDESNEPKLNGRISKETILPILSVGAALSQPNPSGKDSWPKDFYEALLRDDWRDWVQAVKTESDSWSMLEASTEIPFDMMERGASIIPLGELFSIKRNGKYKFRQYALGNMLKEGLRRDLLEHCLRRWRKMVLLPCLLMQKGN
jgi:hypothetical protein